MRIGDAHISKADGSPVLDLQRDALIDASVSPDNIYEDKASGKNDDRPALAACLKALREGDTLIVWKLDRLGRNLKHLVDTVQDLANRGIGFKVLSGQGANIDTTTASGKIVFGLWHLRSVGGIRAGANPRTHYGGIAGRPRPRPQGWLGL